MESRRPVVKLDAEIGRRGTQTGTKTRIAKLDVVDLASKKGIEDFLGKDRQSYGLHKALALGYGK